VSGKLPTSWLVAALLVLLLVVTTTFAVLMWRQHRQDVSADEDRNAAVNVAEQFTLRLDTFSYKDLGAYSKRVAALLTDKMKGDFDQSFKGFGVAFKTIQISSKGAVRSAGIEDIDQDSATVLVIHDVTVTSKGCVQPPYKRMSVDLRKINGKWLVDDFKEGVPGCQG
jgi:Mce-associated membrane protein